MAAARPAAHTPLQPGELEAPAWAALDVSSVLYASCMIIRLNFATTGSILIILDAKIYLS